MRCHKLSYVILIIILDFGEDFDPTRHFLRLSPRRIHAEKNKRDARFSHKRFRWLFGGKRNYDFPERRYRGDAFLCA